ncbi:hypothetical protein [Teichococcus vastitatis]|uniref:hypothetical protein n=1 Tax=Teichococcus vastitatis TaxID=2307076 RepID=UPI000E707BAE|nr:hypothetical protein [Pseudoroseomonas vastitatis]
MTPDRQRQRVYRWEDRVVAPRDATQLPAAIVAGMVEAIWSELGLRHPPCVEPLPLQARRRLADGSRLCIRVSGTAPSWVVLHELAHALSSTAEGWSDGHGAIFVGLYAQLLTRYLRIPAHELMLSLKQAGIAVEQSARPVFLDPAAPWPDSL